MWALFVVIVLGAEPVTFVDIESEAQCKDIRSSLVAVTTPHIASCIRERAI